MNNLNFETLRRTIIDNIEDDKEARELILKITDMELVRDMRKEVINSIQDLDILDAVLQEIQLTESLVVDEDDIDIGESQPYVEDPQEVRSNIMRAILESRRVKSMMPDNLFKYRFNIADDALDSMSFDFNYEDSYISDFASNLSEMLNDIMDINQVLYSDAGKFFEDNKNVEVFEGDDGNDFWSIDDYACFMHMTSSNILKTELKGKCKFTYILSSAPDDVVESIKQKERNKFIK